MRLALVSPESVLASRPKRSMHICQLRWGKLMRTLTPASCGCVRPQSALIGQIGVNVDGDLAIDSHQLHVGMVRHELKQNRVILLDARQWQPRRACKRPTLAILAGLQ